MRTGARSGRQVDSRWLRPGFEVALVLSLTIWTVLLPGDITWQVRTVNLLCVAAVAVRRANPVFAAFLLSATLFYTRVGDPLTAQTVAYVFVVPALTSRRRIGPLLWVALAAVVISYAQPWDLEWYAVDPVYRTLYCVMLAAAVSSFGFLQRAMRSRRRLMVREHKEREARARVEDRARLSEELHDAIGHELSLIAVLSATLPLTGGDQRTADQIASLARNGLAELRQIVAILGDEASGQAGELFSLRTLPALIARVEDTTGTPVRLDDRLDADVVLPPEVGRLAYRVIQESLTNAVKYAPGAPVTVTLDGTAERLTVAVDNGPARRAPIALPSGQRGLTHLADRVQRLRGSLTARPHTHGGFVVAAEFPLS
ncbi:sensor histidine kinase [Nonomuraea soli]|uniref:histidine kinase n=1 Tax=Nonomuraea soli TaxID=1032476 RepID=A0A7W0HSE8_9ACTN|nr:histidine kinase [Nonomuraea soli]MBA2893827.1 signal transduction histidine kinase [Nonomuraea soli]